MAPIRALDLTKIEATTTGGDGMICKSTLIHQYKDRWFLYMMYLTKKTYILAACRHWYINVSCVLPYPGLALAEMQFRLENLNCT
jgi:hypothetical protein